jgi:hypothetical protein
MRTILLLCCPFLIFAQEHSVPIGSDGNQLVLTIENASNSLIRDVQANVRSAPAWAAFKATVVVIDSIPSKAWRDAAFEFRVPEEKADQTAAIVLTIADARGYLLGKRVIKLRTALLPGETKLHHPYPNPANPSSNIQYTLHTLSHVKIEIYNTLGQRVLQLIDADKPAGILSMTWDGKNDQGITVASGMYIIRLNATEKGTQQVKNFTSKILIQK